MNEPAGGSPRFLPRFAQDNSRVAEDSCRRYRGQGRNHTQRLHFLVDTDQHVFTSPDRSNVAATPTACWAPSSETFDGRFFERLEHGFNTAASRQPQRVCGSRRRLPLDLLFGAERGHCTSRGIIRPLNKGETDTWINRLKPAHLSKIRATRRSVRTEQRESVGE